MPDDPAEEMVEIQWVYTPADFFDGKIEHDCGNYSVEIEGGHATARMSAAFYRPGGDFQHALAEKLRSYFRLWQLDRRRVFEIRGPLARRIHPDGTTDITIVLDSVVCVSEVGTPNLISTDANGVVHDARCEHFEAMKILVELRLPHASDPTVRRMLDSFDAAIRYPGNELVYLYEVWDALQTKFRRNKKGRKALGISRRNRSRLTNLANKEPLNQGRHRGRFDTLRDATIDELAEARNIAKEMIEKFLLYLDDRQRTR
ncbi:MAG: hypothetical protein IMZ57_03860 [Acidobacteria bacterium]|nr:hypothetical protein [Acidobacteriota bacterium]